jgi:hypothetical protein
LLLTSSFCLHYSLLLSHLRSPSLFPSVSLLRGARGLALLLVGLVSQLFFTLHCLVFVLLG